MVSKDTRASRASRETHAAANTWSSHSGMTSRANRTSRVTTRDGHRGSLGKAVLVVELAHLAAVETAPH